MFKDGYCLGGEESRRGIKARDSYGLYEIKKDHKRTYNKNDNFWCGLFSS